MTPIQEVLYGDLRRMSDVFRYSAQPVLQRENVAEHSFWTSLIAVTIVAEIGGDYKMMGDVAVRSIFHDIEETGTGDLVRDMKYFDQETRDAIGRVEEVFADRLFSNFGPNEFILKHVWKTAKDDSVEGKIVALADLLCVLAYCERERVFGNCHPAMMRIRKDCRTLVRDKFSDNTVLWPIAEEALNVE